MLQISSPSNVSAKVEFLFARLIRSRLQTGSKIAIDRWMEYSLSMCLSRPKTQCRRRRHLHGRIVLEYSEVNLSKRRA